MRKPIRYGLLLGLVLSIVGLWSDATVAADNPCQVIVSASGDTAVLPAVTGKRYRIHAIAVLATTTDSVAFYIHNGDNDLFGDASNTITVDLDGIDGPAGMILPETRYGWFTSDTAGEAVSINLSAASRPVIVLLVFTYF